MKTVLGAIAATASLAGCAYLTRPVEHPIIEQHAQNRINTFAIIPSRRVMVVKSELPGDPEDKRMLVCAEAPADVSDNLASSLAASLAAAGPATGGGAGVNASAAFASTLQTYGQFLFRRSQGIQLFRDRAYHLCQARMNGFITNEQYHDSMNKVMDQVIPLITAELAQLKDAMPKTQPRTGEAVKPPEVSASGPSTGATVRSN